MTSGSRSGRATRTAAAILLAGVLTAGVAACGTTKNKLSEKIAEKSIEAGGGGDVDIDAKDGDFSIKTEDGEFSTKRTSELPDGWPTDILPVPDGFEVQMANTMKDGETNATTAVLGGTGDPAKIVAIYEDAFDKNGVEIETQSTGSYNMINGTKGATTYNVTLLGPDEDTGEVIVNLAVYEGTN